MNFMKTMKVPASSFNKENRYLKASKEVYFTVYSVNLEQ